MWPMIYPCKSLGVTTFSYLKTVYQYFSMFHWFIYASLMVSSRFPIWKQFISTSACFIDLSMQISWCHHVFLSENSLSVLQHVSLIYLCKSHGVITFSYLKTVYQYFSMFHWFIYASLMVSSRFPILIELISTSACSIDIHACIQVHWCHHIFPILKQLISTLACPNYITMPVFWCLHIFPILNSLSIRQNVLMIQPCKRQLKYSNQLSLP